PAWDSRRFPRAGRSGRFEILASGMPGDTGALPIRADARLLAVTLEVGQSAEHRLEPGRKAYLVAARGRIEVNGMRAEAGDGVAVADESLLRVVALEQSEVVLVDVA